MLAYELGQTLSTLTNYLADACQSRLGNDLIMLEGTH